MAVSLKTLDDLEKMPEYKVGLWYSPYVKVYSIGGSNRVAEISNYPRAYKDTSPHVYTSDVSFTVTEGDLNHEVDGVRFYRDSRDKLFKIGEKATHWMGDSLPSAFPLWIESETLPFTPNIKEHVFPLDKVPAPRIQLVDARIKVGTSYVKLSPNILDSLTNQMDLGRIVFTRLVQDVEKQIIRIKYLRVL